MTVAAVILGGGEGSRLGGVVKPLLRVGGAPILARTCALVRGRVDTLIISSGPREPERFSGFGADLIVPDRLGAGPLAGIFAAVETLEANGQRPDWLLSLAGDCPDLPEDLLALFFDGMTDGTDVVFPTWQDQPYPPNALWRFSSLAARLAEMGGDPQGQGPRRLFTPPRRVDVELGSRVPVNPFAGMNTLSDVVRHARKARETKSA